MTTLQSPSGAEVKAYSDIVQIRLAELTTGLVDDCERLAAQREQHLRKQCEQLQEENVQLRSRLGEDKVKESNVVATLPGGEQEQATSKKDDADKPPDGDAFAALPELLKDCVAGNIALEEDYWIVNAQRPDHDHAFFDTGSTLHQVKVVAAMQGCVLNPSSHLKLAWDIVGIPVLAWDLITIPMQVFDIGETPLMIAMGWVTLIYWTIDMPVTFTTGFFDKNKEGELIMDLRAIAHHYLRGPFALDLLIIGADWAGIFINMLGDGAPSFLQNMSLLRALRISRFIRLTRLKKLKDKWKTVEDNIESEWTLVVLTLLTKIATIMSLNHYIGCVWFLLGSLDIGGYETWLSSHPYPQFGDKQIKLDTAPWGYKYITSVHWAITQFTPGSMHVQAQNIPERIFSIFCLLFGLVVFSSFIASVTQARMQLNKMMAKFDRDLWLLRKYCKQHHVSIELTVRMRRYVDMVVVPKFQKMTVKDVVLLPMLSKHLQDELATEIASQSLHLHPFFKELVKNKAVMTKVCTSAIANVDFARGDVVFNAGQVGHTMYVVAAGVLEYIPHMKHHPPHETLYPGSVVSEAVLWTHWTQQGQLQVSVECSCMLIDAKKFRSMIAGNALVMAFARRYAFGFLDGMNKELRDKGMPSDLQKDCSLGVDIAYCMSPPKASGDDEIAAKAAAAAAQANSGGSHAQGDGNPNRFSTWEVERLKKEKESTRLEPKERTVMRI